MIFPRINIGDQQVIFQEISVNTAIDMAKIRQGKFEHQLTGLCGSILDDKQAGYQLTVQQRYFCLLQYLSSQSKNDLALLKVDVADFMFNDGEKPFRQSVEVDGIQVRQLNGAEIEVLENLTSDYSDWIAGTMCLQIGCQELPVFNACQDQIIIQDAITHRHQIIKAMPASRFNELYQQYILAEEQLTSLVSVGFDDKGVILFPRGADDAPRRFRPNTVFTGATRLLYEALVRYGAADEQRDELISGGSAEPAF